MDKVYKFSEFVLDEKSVSLYAKDDYIPLSSRAFDILLYLIERRGEIVGKDEILDRVWQESFVEEANLPVHISALRRVLREKKGESRFIKTISGRGYSFIGDVEELGSNRVVKDNDRKHLSEKKDISIAVLPFTFENSSEDNEYLANGITQSLIGDLSKIQDLRVFAYSAVKPYKNSDLEINEIGFLLGADKTLTGSISEYKGKWEISAELTRTSDKSCLWMTTQTFDAEDVFIVKKNISSAIVEKLKPKLINPFSGDKKEINYEAQKLYYRGRHIFESRATRKNFAGSLHQALKFFKEAVEIEPLYALAHVGIGKVYLAFHNNNLLDRNEAYREAKKAVQTALLIGDELSEVHILKGSIELFFEYDFAEAERSFDKAIELNPNEPGGYYWKTHICLGYGDFEQALKLMEKVLNRDYISMIYNEHFVRILCFYGKYEEAIAAADELLEFDKNGTALYFFKAVSYAFLGFFESAMELVETAIKTRRTAELILFKACILALFGNKLEAKELLQNVISSFDSASIDKYDIAGVYCVLGEKDKAVEYLNRAFEYKSSSMTKLKIDFRFKSLHEYPRFVELLKKLNFA